MTDRLEHGVVFTLGRYDVLTFREVRQAEDGEVVAFGRAAGEDDLAPGRFDDCRHFCARGFDRAFGAATPFVSPATGVAEVFVQKAQDFLANTRFDGSRRSAIEIDWPRHV